MSINLANVPLPAVIETISFEDIVSDIQLDLIERYPDVEPALQLKSAIINKVIEAFAYREMLLRIRVNDAARALMLATASGTDLDQFASDFGMERLEIGKDAKGDPIFESDEDFRQRRNLAPDGYAAAGPENAYKYHALSADGRIRQVEAIKGDDNRCDVVLLGRDGDGSVSQEIVSKVYNALSPKTRRPLTDNVYVRSVSVVPQVIRVQVRLQSGPDATTLVAKAKAAIIAHTKERSAIGTVLRVDGIIGAAHSGNALESATVIEPAADVDPGKFGTVYVPEVIIEVI